LTFYLSISLKKTFGELPKFIGMKCENVLTFLVPIFLEAEETFMNLQKGDWSEIRKE
tara:strand:+ start:83 stop:253 length:171 start_codon:yes stop_codon:yes gene_type:complete